VQNYTLGTNFVKELKEKSSIPLDIHLMIEDPEKKLEWFTFGEGDYVSVHFEATRHLQKALAAIRARGAKAMVAINPATPISSLDSVLDDIDAVLVMTVNPGFAGQKLVQSTLKKIKNLREYLDNAGYSHIEIEVDGNVSFENAKLMHEAGANIFVCGTSSVYSTEASVEENIRKFRKILA
jgi:ribulose-phosphate 3-epimerase